MTLTNDRARAIAAGVLLVTATACTSSKPYTLDLMPAPNLYTATGYDPLPETSPESVIPWGGVLYATDRRPAPEGEGGRYLDERGGELRLGVARVDFVDDRMTWPEARRVSLLEDRPGDYPLVVTDVEEIGVLDRTITFLTPEQEIPRDPAVAGDRFAQLVNSKLAASRLRDVYLYVHGYKVVFEDPVLVATELWHFLGYEGVFIAYAWPATPKKLAYLKDLETATFTSRNFRLLLEFLADETDARRVHIVGYSAGTRVVLNALTQLALSRTGMDRAAVRDRFRIGSVVLVGSEVDRELFAAAVVDGLLDVPERMVVYQSGIDKAVGLSGWIFGRSRLGERLDPAEVRAESLDFLRDSDTLELIDVTDAERSGVANGHRYFRQSPWASSDILLTLALGLDPEQRGLERRADSPVWSFPDDYPERLRGIVETATGEPPDG